MAEFPARSYSVHREMSEEQYETSADPEQYRMSLGDHLEELRKRIFLALLGFIVAAVACSIWGQNVIQFFCQPLVNVLAEQRISPQLYFTSAGDPFTVYLKITMIAAAVISGPWIIWQLWLFVAAGLYPRERKAIWSFAPLSIALLLSGVVFCYMVVLPLSLRFFITFSGGIELELPRHASNLPTTAPVVMTFPVYAGDPAAPVPFQYWFDSTQQRLKLAVPDDAGNLATMVIQYGPQSLVSPLITLPDYIDMVLLWLLIFGLAFQLPLATMALIKIGLFAPADLAKMRKYVYVGLAVLCSMLMPDVFSGTLMLMIPLCLLYELGIILGRLSLRKRAKSEPE